MEVTALPGLARGIVSNRRLSDWDRHRRFIWRFDEDSAVRRVFAVVVDRGWGVGW